MKFNYKSRKGFTLIELLVVIGILAVLAAIAIPSVAGLIDRANASADNTNANEMTNAMERFVSEYELYKQDIASGAIKDENGDGIPDDMDTAQSRVYNVTKAVTRADIEKLESKEGLNGIRIDIDNKYAQNHATAKAVMQNYMKTSSSTFEPKQSDMTYWYHTETGYIVVSEKYSNTESLCKKLPTNVNPEKTGYVTDWIDLSSSYTIPDLRVSKIEASTEDGKTSLIFTFTLANPINNNIDISNIYYMFGKEANGLLSMENNHYVRKLSDKFDINDAVDKGDFINLYFTLNLVSASLDERVSFRVCYEYEENGQKRYFYSPILTASFNELTEYSNDNLPY